MSDRLIATSNEPILCGGRDILQAMAPFHLGKLPPVCVVITLGCSEILQPIVRDADAGPAEGSLGGTAPGGGGTGAQPGPDAGPPVAGSGGAQPGVPMECPLSWDKTGWVQQTECGFQGAWYTYNDCDENPEDCTRVQKPAILTQFVATLDEQLGTYKACTSGTTAAPANEAELTTKWGAGMALNLYQPGGDADPLPVEAVVGDRLLGVGFELETLHDIPDFRVNFPMGDPGDSEPYMARPVEPLLAGTHTITVLLRDTELAAWAEDRTKQLRPETIVSVQFQVATVVTSPPQAVPFDFCVKNLVALVSPP